MSSSAYITPSLSDARAPTSRAASKGARGITPSASNPSGRMLKTQSSLPVFGLGDDAGSSQPAKGPTAKSKKLGMFKGVLVPTCENMWGVIIFLRFYTIVGYAGLGYTILIVTLSFMVALLTALALSAIATCGTSHNLAGVYPMMARALGREVATATCLIYFVGIVCLAVLECLGACEELFQVAPILATYGGARVWGLIFLSALSAFVAGGIKTVSHLGLVFFAVVVVTLLFLYISLLAAPYTTAIDKPPPTAVNASSGSGSGSGSGTHTHRRGLFFPDVSEVGLSGSVALDAAWSTAEEVHGRMMAGAGEPAPEGFQLIFPSGLSMKNFEANLGPAFEGSYFFGDCLSIFFPCFTGILSGANRASSLREPVTAIPNGTLGAIIFSYFMYLSLMVLWAGVGSREYLKMHHGQINTIFYPTVMGAQIGIILSSLGQALQCLVVAPRLLAAIAASETIRAMKPLAVLTAGEPKRALLLTYIIGSCIAMLGSLNLVAPLLSMCFLLCYACMNLNSFFLDFLKDPHWRPKWRFFHWSIGLAGFVLCTTMMFLIQWIYALVAWGLMVTLLAYILRSNISLDYGSALTGLRFHVAIRSLLSIDMGAHLSNNWKPQLLVLYGLREVEQHEAVVEIQGELEGEDGAAGVDELAGPPLPASMIDGSSQLKGMARLADTSVGHTHEHMFAVAHQLRHGSGLLIAAAILQLGADQHSHDLAPVIAAEEEERRMQDLMTDMGVRGFAMTVLTHDATEGKAYAIQCARLGPLTPNTVLMGWPWWWKSDPDRYVPEFLSTIHHATLRQKALLVCHNVKDFPTNAEPQTGYIDVWWIKHDGGLLLLISHLLQKHRVWRQCRLRLHLITEVGTDTEHLKARIHKLLHRINISAHVEEVIQIDTASLLPYMVASRERERNEMMVERELRAQGHEDQAEVHTAEAMLEQPSPRMDSQSARFENPLDDVPEDGNRSTHGTSFRGKIRRSSLRPSTADPGGPDPHGSDSDDARLGSTPQIRRSVSHDEHPHTFSKGFRKGDREHQRQAAAFQAAAALGAIATPAAIASAFGAMPSADYNAMPERSVGAPAHRRASAPHLLAADHVSHEGVALEDWGPGASGGPGVRRSASRDHSLGHHEERTGAVERPGSALAGHAASAHPLSAIPIDTTGDGQPDAWAIDTTHDGRIDTIIPAARPPAGDRGVTPPPSPPTAGSNDDAEAAASSASRKAKERKLSTDLTVETVKGGAAGAGAGKSGGGSPVSPTAQPGAGGTADGVPSPQQSANRWSLCGKNTAAGGSKSSLSAYQLPPAAVSCGASGGANGKGAERNSNDEEEGGRSPPGSPSAKATAGEGAASSSKRNSKRGSSSCFSPMMKSTAAAAGSGADADADADLSTDTRQGRHSRQGSEKGMVSSLLAMASGGGGSQKQVDSPKSPKATEVQTPLMPRPEGDNAITFAQRQLEAFAAKHGLTPQAEEELRSMFKQTVETVHTQKEEKSYRWDQIHEMIVSHSPGTSLVIVNLPDPPDANASLTPEEQMDELVEYMNYMEGVALNLPRVLYVHGSGQEVINFDRME